MAEITTDGALTITIRQTITCAAATHIPTTTTVVAAPTAPAPATESKPKQPPLAGRWCPHCGGLMLEYMDGDHEECLDCSKAIEITPAAKAAKASGQVILGFGMYPR